MLRQLVKDSMIYGAGDFVFKFVAFAIFPIYTHIFSVSSYGVMELISTLVGFTGLFISLGIDNAVQRFYWDPSIPEENRPILVSSGLWTLGSWSVLVTTLMIVIFFFFRNFIETKYQISFSYFSLALVTNFFIIFLQFSQNILRLHFSPWKYTLLSGLKNLFGVFFGLYLIVFLKQGLLGFFLGSFIAAILTVPFSLWLIRKELRFTINLSYCKQLVKFGYPFIFAGLAYWLFGSVDRWMLGTMTNNNSVGLYSVAFKFASVVLFINSAFGQAWAPLALKSYAENPEYRTFFSKILSYWFFGLTIIGSSITLFASEALHLLTPPAYWPAVTGLGFIIMGVVLQGTTQITVIGISLERKTNILSLVVWQTVILNIGLNWILIKLWGITGAALTMMLSYLFLSGGYLIWAQKLHPIPLENKKLLYSLVVIVLTLFLMIVLNQFTWIWWFIFVKLIFISLIIYGGFKYKLIPEGLLNFFYRKINISYF